MKVRVEHCWGGNRSYFRLTLPNGERELLRGDTWTRKIASEALDIAERLYGANRNSVRFIHH